MMFQQPQTRTCVGLNHPVSTIRAIPKLYASVGGDAHLRKLQEIKTWNDSMPKDCHPCGSMITFFKDNIMENNAELDTALRSAALLDTDGMAVIITKAANALKTIDNDTDCNVSMYVSTTIKPSDAYLELAQKCARISTECNVLETVRTAKDVYEGCRGELRYRINHYEKVAQAADEYYNHVRTLLQTLIDVLKGLQAFSDKVSDATRPYLFLADYLDGLCH